MDVTNYFGKIDISNTKKSSGLLPTKSKPSTVDLSFLTDRERAIILKVIKADLELRKTTLGYLKKVIEAGRKFQLTQKSTTSQTSKCTCCGKVFNVPSDKKSAVKCVQCKLPICNECARTQDGETVCIVCIKEKLYTLQSMDYLPVFHHETSSDNVDSDELETTPKTQESEPLYGSDLLKMSLEATRKQVIFAKKEENNKLSLELPVKEPEKPIRQAYSSSVYDPNSGFKLIREEATQEALIDLCSLYSEPCNLEDVEVSGKMQFGVWYNKEQKILYVRISKMEKLATVKDGSCDPYVKTYLLPGKHKLMKRRTGIHRATTKPEINELLKYGNISDEEVRMKILWVSVWDWDRFGRNEFLGEVRIPLSSVDLTDTTDRWLTLEKRGCDECDYFETRGKILISLKYDPYGTARFNPDGSIVSTNKKPGMLHILLHKAEDLKPNDDVTAIVNPFVRCYLLPYKFVDTKRKSGVASNTLNPVWNSEVMYPHVTLEDLESSRVLEVTVWDEDRRGVNQFIGGVRLGPDPLTSMSAEWMDSTGSEVSHWEAMLAQPGEWVEQWHHLRPTMDSLPKLEEKRKHLELPQETAHSSSIASTPSIIQDSDSDSSISRSSREPSPDFLPDIRKLSDVSSSSLTSKQPRKGDYNITGEILVTVEYKNGEIVVYVDRAMGLAAANKDGTSDSYVKTYLLPDRSKQSKRKTEVQRKTIDPLYNATLKYKVPFDKLGTRAIWLTVWNYNRFGPSLFLGEVCIPLTSLNLKQATEKWYGLTEATETDIPGVVLPTAPVHIEEDLLARTPAPHRRRTTAVTTGSLRSLHSRSDSPSSKSHLPKILVDGEVMSTEIHKSKSDDIFSAFSSFQKP